MASYNDIMTFENLPAGLVGSIMAAIDDFCLSVCVPAVDDLSKAPPLKWLSCMAYVGRVCTVKYIRLLYTVYEEIPTDNKTPEASAPILNDNTPEGVRRGVYDLVPCYIWLCGLYNKIVTPDGFSSFCGYPVGIEGEFLGTEKPRINYIQLSEDPEGIPEPVAVPKAGSANPLYNNNLYEEDNTRPKGSSFYNDFFGGALNSDASEGGRSLARWKETIYKALKEQQNATVDTALLDPRLPTVLYDTKRSRMQAEIIEKVAPAALSLADLPRLR